MTTAVANGLEELRSRVGNLCIFDFEELERIVRAHRTLGKRIVLTSGTFDMWHIGHQRYLARGKALGDILIVGVDSNAKVRGRKREPLDAEEDRLEVVLGCRHVDHVFLKPAEAVRWSLIRAVRPDFLLVTKETYNPGELAEVKKLCGEVVVLPPQAATSTTARMRLLLLRHGKPVLDALDKAITNVGGELHRARNVVAEVLGGDGRG